MTFEERKAEEFIDKNCKLWEEGELTVDEIVRLTYIACLKEALKMKVNTTTISDAPLMEREQLAQAKEIIKFLINPQLLDKPQYYEWRLKAEQFLKGVENV